MKISANELQELLDTPIPCSKEQRMELERVVIKEGLKYQEMIAVARSIAGRYIKQIGELSSLEIEEVIQTCKQATQLICRERLGI